MILKINIKYLILLSFAFAGFAVIGTISHEYGHIIVARSLGYDTKLHYASMNYYNSRLNKKRIEIYHNNKTKIEEGKEFDQIEEYNSFLKELKRDRFLILVGGPAQTILTAIFGFMILYFRRKNIINNGFKFIDWLAIFLSLFWLREVFNLFMSVIQEILSPNGSFYGGDETKISIILNLWPGTISLILGVFGLIISTLIVFKIIPNKLRFTFIISGLIGGVSGYIIWMDILGPALLP